MDKNILKIQNLAVNWLNRRMFTEEEIRKKLRKKFPEFLDEIEKIINELKNNNLIDDEHYVRTYLTYETSTNFRGKFAYLNKLFAKGVSKDIFEQIWLEINPDELEMAKKLINQNQFRFQLEDPVKKKLKIQRFLRGRGFSTNIIQHFF
jgi:regulatory protein